MKERDSPKSRSRTRCAKQLRDENARLKRMVADLTLDKHIWSEVVRKNL